MTQLPLRIVIVELFVRGVEELPPLVTGRHTQVTISRCCCGCRLSLLTAISISGLDSKIRKKLKSTFLQLFSKFDCDPVANITEIPGILYFIAIYCVRI